VDPLIRTIIEKHTPKMNPDIVNGLAYKLIPNGIEYIDRVIRGVAKSFPPGLEYVECAKCTPQEEFREITKPRGGARRSFDIAKSDVYLVKYRFRYEGKDLPLRHVYHPNIREGGLIWLSGSEYMCSPVLSDRVISPGEDNVFVRILRDKVKFERTKHMVNVDGIRRSITVVSSVIYKRNKNAKKVMLTTKAESTPIHYLIARYGFDEAMKRLIGFVPETGLNFSKATHHPDEWVLVQSTGIKPKTCLDYLYRASPIVFAVPKHLFSHHVMTVLGSVFYVIDHFPEKVKIEYLNNQSLFAVLLGEIIFSGIYKEGELLGWIREHFSSLELCMDQDVIADLDALGFSGVADFFDMMVLIINNFNDFLLKGSEEINAMYGKELSILYDVYYPITHSIINMSFLLTKAASKKKLTEREVVEIMNKSLTQGKIYELTNRHISMSSVSYSGDNKFYKITSVIVPQTAKSRQVKTGRKTQASDQVKTLHPSFAEAGGYLNLTKPDPSGFARVNPYVKLDARGTIVRKEHLKPVLDKVAYMLKHKVHQASDETKTAFERKQQEAL